MDKLRLLVNLGFVTSLVIASNATVRAEVGTEVSELEKINNIARETILSKALVTEIPNLKDLIIPSSSASSLLAQQVEINEVTGIKVKQTNNGFELVLETANSDKLQPASRSEGNVFIVEIPNAQLKLTSENTFRQEKPATGIAEIEVVNSSESSIKIAIKGEASLPKVELVENNYNLPVSSIFPLSQEIAELGSKGIFSLQYPDHYFTHLLHKFVENVIQESRLDNTILI